MKIIPLANGMSAVVDDEDFELVSQYKWHPQFKNGSWYARTAIYDASTKKTANIKMHRLIMGLDGPPVDHRDCDGLNNRRENLRHCTNQQNQANNRKQAGTTSQHKGVYWNKHRQMWRAHIAKGGKRIHLGYFHSESEAAVAYQAKATELFGEFARA